MSLADLHVMLVEDHGFQRRLGLSLLADLGLTKLHDAAGGDAALVLLRSMERVPDVILVDLDMPGMDGVEFIGHIAKEKLARSIAVVSAMDPALMHAVHVMAQASGLLVLGSVEKPLSHGKLTSLLSVYADGPVAGARVEDVAVTTEQVREALTRGEIVPHFQPQTEFLNGKVTGVEALARWRLADGRAVSTEAFLGLIEAGGMMEQLTTHMLTESCRWQQHWRRQGYLLRISVNVSATTLTGPDVADRYEALVRAQGVEPAHVLFEITESTGMGDVARTLGMLARLRLKGFGLSVDDFGTGYSSLAQLSQIPFTELKIDRGFVIGSPKLPRKRAVIEASLDLARKLDLQVVAEGVETMEEWKLLASLGCDVAQGYLISPAVPGEQLPETIRNWRKPED
jgi:EAL domain-containing protein (putative c-di-GMP-specific phosphodiesterase class I)/CheY-like chemotaxis protein